jgi:cyclase
MRKRVIPVLLVDERRRLIKTVRFGERTYIGDPFNVVRLFNEKEVDEICVLDIDAGPQGREPDYDFIEALSSECFMPLAYGGGISRLEHCERLNRMGVEKIVLGHGAMDRDLVRAIHDSLGAQALTVCVDVTGQAGSATCKTRSGRHDTRRDPLDLCRELESWGVGEVILQSIDRDGTRGGMDLELIRRIAPALGIPLVALGGAGDVEHLAAALKAGASAVASGSAFSFIGRLRAVLISYPSAAEIATLSMEAR